MRRRSTVTDGVDTAALRDARDAIGGHYANEWLQPQPDFWTADGFTVPLRGNFKGATAFLITSGPSFNAMNKEPLKYSFTFCVNNSYKACLPHFVPSAWTCVDNPSRFLAGIWCNPAIMKFVPMGLENDWFWNSMPGHWHPFWRPRGRERRMKVREVPNTLFYRRNQKFNAERFLLEDTVNWGMAENMTDAYGHKGGRSVMLAAIKLLYMLGFRCIFILGADFRMSSTADGWYSFPQGRHVGAQNCNNSTYQALNKRFAGLRPYAEAMGLEIYNCTPNSGLTAFKHVPYHEAIARALWFADGKIESLLNEVTENMYQDPAEKLGKWESENANN